MNYQYADIGLDIGALAASIEAQLPLPDAYCFQDDLLTFVYDTPLTDPQKANLDSLIAAAASTPDPSGSVVLISHPEAPRIVRNYLTTNYPSVTFTIRPNGGSQWRIAVSVTLTDAQKFKLMQKFSTILYIL